MNLNSLLQKEGPEGIERVERKIKEKRVKKNKDAKRKRENLRRVCKGLK